MPRDLEEFDLILTMDHDNYINTVRLDRSGKHHGKVVPMCRYILNTRVSEVPDPWYGGSAGFELVIRLLEDGCANLLNEIAKNNSL